MGTQPIRATLPQPPEVSLLTTALPFALAVETVGEGEAAHTVEVPLTYDRWKTGVGARSLACIPAFTEAGCGPIDPEDPEAVREDPAEGSTYEFLPGRTWLPHGCAGFVDDEPEWEKEARAALDAKLPYHAARELWTGEETGNPSLQSVGQDISSVTPVKVKAAMGLVIANYEECTQGILGFIHVPSTGLVSLVDDGIVKRVGNHYETAAGHRVVPGPGYPQSPGTWGPTTDDDPDGIAAPDGAMWIYMSPPVELAGPHYKLAQPKGEREDRLNRFDVIDEAWFIYRFDPCCVFAALAIIPN